MQGGWYVLSLLLKLAWGWSIWSANKESSYSHPASTAEKQKSYRRSKVPDGYFRSAGNEQWLCTDNVIGHNTESLEDIHTLLFWTEDSNKRNLFSQIAKTHCIRWPVVFWEIQRRRIEQTHRGCISPLTVSSKSGAWRNPRRRKSGLYAVLPFHIHGSGASNADLSAGYGLRIADAYR